MKIESRNSVSMKLKGVDYSAKEHDFIELCEWSNGEGWDVIIQRGDGNPKMLSLSFAELECINFLKDYLNFHDKIK
jgi:hypothetical protein